MTNSVLESVAREMSARHLSVEQDKQMALLTTYGVGGCADVAVTVRTRADIVSVAEVLSSQPGINVVVLGRGSNTLFADEGFRGVVVIMGNSDDSRHLEQVDQGVRVSGSMLMPVLARRTVQAGLGGLEWCVGIPGTVGGAVRMNAGGHGADIKDSLVTADIVSLTSGVLRSVDVSQLGLHFRGSALSPHHIVVTATFETHPTSVEDGTRMLDDIVSWRRANQPGGRNAGSVFVNPAPGEGSAGALIDQCGLRGFTVGGAQVSDKHANFIQATENATARDIVAVMQHVQDTVAEKHGVVLRSEVRLVGFDVSVSSRFSDDVHNSGDNISSRRRLCELLGESDG